MPKTSNSGGAINMTAVMIMDSQSADVSGVIWN